MQKTEINTLEPTVEIVNVDKTDKEYIYIGRGTVYGNQFVIGIDGDRDEVIAKYRDWFYDKIKYDTEFYKKVLELKNQRIGCHCKPKACHGDVIKQFIEGLA